MTPLLCLVVAISDGDTLKVRCPDQPQQVVRLAEIDAPEKAQPFGQRSKQALSDLCFQVQAELEPQKLDRYGRTVGRVSCRGQDASAAQVGAGMAWVYRKYAPAGSPLVELEAEARNAQRGLWSDREPVPPWEWRKARNR